jgi:hypothetical protein
MSQVIKAILVLMVSRAAWACQCAGHPSVADVFSRAPVVVTGVVVGRHPVVIRGSEIKPISGTNMPRLFPINRVDVAVTRVFKGDVGRSFELSEFGCCVCEYNFVVGESYLILAHPHPDLPNRWMASFCWPTKPEKLAGADVAILGRPVRVFTGPPSDSRSAFRKALDSLHAFAAPVVRRSLYRESFLTAEQRTIITWSSVSLILFIAAGAVFLRGISRGARPPNSS